MWNRMYVFFTPLKLLWSFPECMQVLLQAEMVEYPGMKLCFPCQTIHCVYVEALELLKQNHITWFFFIHILIFPLQMSRLLHPPPHLHHPSIHSPITQLPLLSFTPNILYFCFIWMLYLFIYVFLKKWWADGRGLIAGACINRRHSRLSQKYLNSLQNLKSIIHMGCVLKE